VLYLFQQFLVLLIRRIPRTAAVYSTCGLTKVLYKLNIILGSL